MAFPTIGISRFLNITVFQDHVQLNVMETMRIEQPPALLKKYLLAVANLNKPAIVQFLGLAGSRKTRISFVDKILDANKRLALFENPIGNSHRN